MKRKNGSKIRMKNGIVAALDVGSSKVTCFIAKPGSDGKPEILGIGQRLSNGVKSGIIVDMDAAEASIRAAVEAAEHMAGETVDSVFVALNAGDPTSRRIHFEIALDGHQISESDVRRVLDPEALNEEEPADRQLIHAIPISYSIDGNGGVKDPVGIFGNRLGVNLHRVTAGTAAIRTLETCISRCHLKVDAEVVTPYASGLGCLVDDEMDLGVTLIDLGGGTTTISVFMEGQLVHTDSIRIGGMHVTNDIAKGLSTSVNHAERIKTLFGSALPSQYDDHEVIKVQMIGEEESHAANQVPRSMLVGIIRPRIEETLELVRSRLEASGFAKLTGRHVVLTGGGSQLTGVREMVGLMLDKQVRLGRPSGVKGLAESTGGGAFSTGVGLLKFALDKQPDFPLPMAEQAKIADSPLGKLGNWIRQNF